MPYSKFTPRQPDPFIKKAADQEIAKFGHLNAIIGILNSFAPGGILSIGNGTGITIDNTNPSIPIINFTGGSNDVDNDSGVAGATVSDALDVLAAMGGGNLTQVLTSGNDAGGLDITNLNNLYVNNIERVGTTIGINNTSGNASILLDNAVQEVVITGNIHVQIGDAAGNLVDLSASGLGLTSSAGDDILVTSGADVIINTAGVGIGGTPNSVAALDIQTTTKGVKFPSQTTAQRQAIVTTNLPGIVVYDTTIDGLFCTNNAGNWVQL